MEEKQKCKKCKGNKKPGYNRDGSKCRWCDEDGNFIPPPKKGGEE